MTTMSIMSIPADAASVTPSDTTELMALCLYVGGAGDVAVLTERGNSVTFTGVTAGSLLPIRATKVLATGTTATNIVRMF